MPYWCLHMGTIQQAGVFNVLHATTMTFAVRISSSMPPTHPRMPNQNLVSSLSISVIGMAPTNPPFVASLLFHPMGSVLHSMQVLTWICFNTSLALTSPMTTIHTCTVYHPSSLLGALGFTIIWLIVYHTHCASLHSTWQFPAWHLHGSLIRTMRNSSSYVTQIVKSSHPTNGQHQQHASSHWSTAPSEHDSHPIANRLTLITTIPCVPPFAQWFWTQAASSKKLWKTCIMHTAIICNSPILWSRMKCLSFGSQFAAAHLMCACKLFLRNYVTSSLWLSTQTQSAVMSMHIAPCNISACNTTGQKCFLTLSACARHAPDALYQILCMGLPPS